MRVDHNNQTRHSINYNSGLQQAPYFVKTRGLVWAYGPPNNMPPSPWIQDALCKYPTFEIRAEERDSSIYAIGRAPAHVDRRLKRIDMSAVDYKPTCNADKLFWEAAVDLYNTKIKFIPQEEAHIFVERCYETHIYKSYSMIWHNRIERALRTCSREPDFADVIILSLLHGYFKVIMREWCNKWSWKYAIAFEFPKQIDGLFSEDNLATEGFQTTRKRKKPKETATAASHVARKKTTNEKSLYAQTRLVDDERYDDEPWMEMYSNPAKAPSPAPFPQDSGQSRRQSAVVADKRTQDLYKYFPVNQGQRKALGELLGQQCDKAYVSPTLIVDASDDEAGDVLDSHDRHETGLGQSYSDPDIVEIVDLDVDEDSPMLGETDTDVIEEVSESPSTAAGPVQSDLPPGENVIGYATAEELIQQLDEAQETSESVVSQVEALNITEAHIEATFDLLKDGQDEPAGPSSVSDLVQRCKDALAEEQKHILHVERLQEEVTARRVRTEELEKELAASRDDLTRLERELDSACAKLTSGRVHGV